MKTLFLTVGLPRSGKSTWARNQIASGYAVVNPDSIRLALHGQPYIASAEGFVWAIARNTVKALFLAGHDKVILDATNTTRKARDAWRSEDWQREFMVFNTPAQECIQRAIKDERGDLIKVIHRMSEQFEPLTDEECFGENVGIG